LAKSSRDRWDSTPWAFYGLLYFFPRILELWKRPTVNSHGPQHISHDGQAALQHLKSGFDFARIHRPKAESTGATCLSELLFYRLKLGDRNLKIGGPGLSKASPYFGA
jgi:hypothetical protein